MHDQGKIIAGPRPYGRDKEKTQQVRFPEQKRAQQRWFLKLSLIVLLISLIILGFLKLTNPQTFPIQSVRIQGNYSNVDHALLRKTVLPFLRSNFFTIDTTGLQDRLQQLPWVNQVSVKRTWPDVLVITLSEQIPIARFNNNLLSNQGDLFSINQTGTSAQLPLFIGPEGQQELMLQTYQQMLAILAPLHLKISVLALDARQSWRLKLSNGIVLLLGKTAPLPRLQRFVTVYQQVVGAKSELVKSVDLRYAGGLAVSFAATPVSI